MTVEGISEETKTGWLKAFRLRDRLTARLNRGLPDTVQIRLRVWWPLAVLPIAVVNQILAPHPVWLVLVISLFGIYFVALFWVRSQADRVVAIRKRTGAFLVAGDTLHQEFELRNDSRLPVLWAEFIDESELPGHSPGRVAACGPYTSYRWDSDVMCERRGVFRLGPHRLHFGDPFGLFAVEVVSPQSDMVLIYPRVVHLPEFELPHGIAGESRRRRRPMRGALPSASVRDYQAGDSLRHVHWRSSARRGALTVKELEIEPSGDVWVVLDLFRQPNADVGADKFERSIIVAASVAAKMLSEGERRAVGLLAVSGRLPPGKPPAEGDGEEGAMGNDVVPSAQDGELERRAVLVPPQPGQAQLWRILSALAPVEPTDMPLAGLLRNSREVLGSRKTLIVVTAQTRVDATAQGYEHRAIGLEAGSLGAPIGANGSDAMVAIHSENHPDAVEEAQEARQSDADGGPGLHSNWVSELAHLRSSGLDSMVLLVTDREAEDGIGSQADALTGLLAGEDIGCQILDVAEPLRPALTFRRTRKVVRTTPSGGVVTYEVEEDVG